MKANLLRAEIAKKNLSVSEFLNQISMPKSTWSKRMRGVNCFNQNEIQNIINVLGLTDRQVMSIFFNAEVSQNTAMDDAAAITGCATLSQAVNAYIELLKITRATS